MAGLTTVTSGGISDGTIQNADINASAAIDASKVSGLSTDSITEGNTTVEVVDTGSDGHITFDTEGSERMRIISSGKVGIGTTSPNCELHVGNTSANPSIEISRGAVGDEHGYRLFGADGAGNVALKFLPVDNGSVGSETMRIDGSGRLLLGTSTNMNGGLLCVGSGQGTNSPSGEHIKIGPSVDRIEFLDSNSNSSDTGSISLYNTVYNNRSADIELFHPAGNTGGIKFSTHNGTSLTERMRIAGDGDTFFAKTSNVFNSPGFRIAASGLIEATVNAGGCLNLNRTSDDGGMVGFYQDGIAEGNIDVSGTTVSYNGAHLSRWSQLAGGAERIEILRGSVLSNLDEMCEWGEENNEQLNRMKVSDVEGDRNVSGVFQSWDDDDDTYTNDFYCAMTGDFVIRIAQGTTVARGDLLMSAGDGTAKPQDDDIVRSKTIAKVTSTTVSTTYDDGSYCVPCVLMAC